MKGKPRALKAGEYVEVRSREEILATLDADGTLEKLPFMPEMLKHCGTRLRIGSVAHKTCDPAHKTGGRRLERAVHLDNVRCDGSAHGGCQANCLIFWKEAWLKRPGEPSGTTAADRGAPDLEKTTRKEGGTPSDPIYRCQATELFAATQPLPWWDLRQYFQDWRSGNASLGRILKVFLLAVFRGLVKIGIGYRFLIGCYDRFQAVVGGGGTYPFRQGTLPSGAPAPVNDLQLQPGELVRVKPYDEILATLTRNNKNRGLWFDAEMVSFCGHDYRVLRRVETIIDEKNGKMLNMKTPCIMLDGVVCRSIYTPNRLLCPRAIFPYWREAWLQRANDAHEHAEGARSSAAASRSGEST